MPTNLETHDLMNYRRAGEGPVLVLVHGFLLGSGFWDPLIDLLKDRYDVLAPDLPGFASSGHLPPCGSLPELADRVLDLLDDLDVDEFSLMGHSMGGVIVQQMAVTAPPRINKLVVYGAAATVRPTQIKGAPRPRGAEERQAVLEKEGVDGLRRWMAPYWFAAGEESPFIDEACATGAGGSEEAAKLGQAYMGKLNLSEKMGEIAAPTLVIGGDRDKTFTVEAMAELARGVSDGRLSIIPDAAHCPHYEQPDLFNQALSGFLTGG